MKKLTSVSFAAGLLAINGAAPALAAKEAPVELVKCEQSFGTIAVVDGDTQGWSEYGLGSPRELINSLAMQSGCFTPLNPSSGASADFLMNVVAGDKEEVDQSIEAARGMAMTGLVHSGVAGSLLSSVPGAGAVLGMFGGFGGKKRTVAAGIKLLSPATGQTMALGSGEVKKSTLNFSGAGNAWAQGAQAAGYASNKNGQMITEAFIKAFNVLAAQGPALAAMQTSSPAAASAPKMATVSADTTLRATPAANGTAVRSLRAGTTLTPTGKREGLFLEVEDNFGTKGWVSVEQLN